MKSIGRRAGFVAAAVALCAALAEPGSGGVVALSDMDSGLPSPTGTYRWLDVADQAYGTAYQETYDYTQAEVEIHFADEDTVLQGVLLASGLKPNFTYQLKLVGEPGTTANERIGFTGRWWQEEWDGVAWTGGQNLNNKGDGTSPNPNDLLYVARRDIVDPGSPSGLQYRFTGYLVFAYFVTDGFGEATVPYQVHSCFHVLWKTTQRTPGADDGPVLPHAMDPDPALHSAYSVDYPPATVSVFGEWERLPMGDVRLAAGPYACAAILTEESFHGSGGALAGNWAGAMAATLDFTIVDRVTGVGEDRPPARFRLEPPHPNPFRGRTEIAYETPEGSAAVPVLDVVDVTGRRVAVLGGAGPAPGSHRLTWSGTDTSGRRVAPGVYFLRLVSPGRPAVSRSVVLLP